MYEFVIDSFWLFNFSVFRVCVVLSITPVMFVIGGKISCTLNFGLNYYG